MTGFAANVGSPREPRPRRYVSKRTLGLLRFLGFRHSLSRDAYILRIIGGRFGPVLKARDSEPAVTYVEPLSELDARH